MAHSGRINSHRDLVVWQKAMDLAVDVYRLTQAFPKSELYGLTGQMRRAAASVPANIAEGHARGTAKDYANFLAVAKGSLMETETFITLSVRLGYATEEASAGTLALIMEISKMPTALRSKLRG